MTKGNSILPKKKPPKDPSPTKGSLLTSEERAAGLSAIENRILDLNRANINSVPLVTVPRNHPNQVPNVKISTSTLERYTTAYKGFLDFLILMEDYDSAMLLHPTKCPSYPLPVSDELAIIYMRYHVMERGDTVIHPKTGQPVVIRKRNNQRFHAVGDWRAISTLGIFRSALSFLHSRYDCCRGTYVQQCPQCHAIPLAQIQKGESCEHHPNDSRYWRRGNVINSEEFKLHMRLMEKYIDENYESRSTVALFPSELRKIRNYLMAMNDLNGLMLWCLIILGVRLYLRVDEVLSLTIESFIPEYFVVKRRQVMTLCVKVKGKTDQDYQHFQVFDDLECPELSAVRPLLLFLAASGRKQGYIFPTLSQIMEPFPTIHYEYPNALSDLQYLCQDVLKKNFVSANGHRIFSGTHTLRKTAFLLAYWGIKTRLHSSTFGPGSFGLPPEDQASILLDARHCAISSTMTYLGDAATMFDTYQRIHSRQEEDTEEKVAPYNHIYIKSLSNVLSIANSGDSTTPTHSMSLPQLSSWFVRDILAVPPANQLEKNVLLNWQKTQSLYTAKSGSNSHSSSTLVLNQCRSFLPPQIYESLQNHIHQLSKVTEDNLPCCLAQLPPASATVTPTKTRRRRATSTSKQIFSTSKDFMSEFKAQKSDEDRILVIMEACEEIRSLWVEDKRPERRLREWYTRAKKVEACVRDCFQGDIQQFILNTSGSLRPSRFQCPNGINHGQTT